MSNLINVRSNRVRRHVSRKTMSRSLRSTLTVIVSCLFPFLRLESTINENLFSYFLPSILSVDGFAVVRSSIHTSFDRNGKKIHCNSNGWTVMQLFQSDDGGVSSGMRNNFVKSSRNGMEIDCYQTGDTIRRTATRVDDNDVKVSDSESESEPKPESESESEDSSSDDVSLNSSETTSSTNGDNNSSNESDQNSDTNSNCFDESAWREIQLEEIKRRQEKAGILELQTPTESSSSSSSSATAVSSKSSSSLPFVEPIQSFISSPQSELAVGMLVLLSSFLAAVGTLPTLPPNLAHINLVCEDIISYMFVLEFMLRWYGEGELDYQYLTKPSAILDMFLSILPLALTKLFPLLGSGVMMPSWLMSNSGLVNLRLLRILRLQRVLSDMDTFTNFFLAIGWNPLEVRPYQLQLARVLLSIFTLLSVSTGLIYTAEHQVNPLIPDYFTALYFGLTTLTTVGFGDITPVTFQGRLVVCGSILAGVAVIPGQAASLVEALLEQQNERQARKTKGVVTAGSSLRRNMNSSSSTMKDANINNSISNNDIVPDQMVDTRVICSICGAMSHRVDAKFCWSCGSRSSLSLRGHLQRR